MAEPTATPPTHPIAAERIPTLDGLRGIAIGLVLLNHLPRDLNLEHANFYTRHYDWVLHGLHGFTQYAPWEVFVLMACKSGWIGVDLFFVLSGFFITGILLRQREAPHARLGGGLRTFYLRRALRIWPPYLAFLAVIFWLLPAVGLPLAGPATRAAQGWFWSHLMNIHTMLHDWPEDGLAHLWSLALEEQFYLVWPLAVWFCPRRLRLPLLWVLIPFAAILRFTLFRIYADPSMLYVLPVTRMDALAGGALFAVLLASPGGMNRLRRLRPWLFGAALCSAAALAFTFVQRGLLYFAAWGTLLQTAGYSLIAAGAMSLLGLALTAPQSSLLHRALSWPPLRWLGFYSYAIYLLHPALDRAARLAGLHPSDWAQPPIGRMSAILLYTLLMALLSCLGGWLSWHVLEKQCLLLRDRWLPSRRAPPLPIP